jgi:hypothetical protein
MIYKDVDRTNLAAAIDSLLAMDRVTLVRTDLADLGFQSVADDVDRIRRLVLRLSVCDLELVTTTGLHGSSQFCAEAQGIFNRMQTFNPIRSNTSPMIEREQIAQQVRNVFSSSADRLLSVLAIAMPTLQENEEQARLILESAKLSANDVLGEVQAETAKAKQEIETTLESVRKATGAIGIEKQAEVFKNAAGEHSESTKRWLRTTVVLASVTAFVLIANWFAAYRLGPPATTIALAQLSIAKILVFSFLLSAVIWSGKVYRSHQHNYVLNKHRQNALETFQLFSRGAEDAETKSMVLLQATKSIFAPQATGFLSGDHETDGSGPQILEVIRSLGSTTK